MTINTLIVEITQRLQQVNGIEAITLGGSRARGTHHAGSDIDLGLYYQGDRPLDIAAIAQIAADIDDQHRTEIITSIGEWGPWINGGGWLVVQGIPVDFLYRDLQKVATVIDQCHAGEIQIDYQPGHPQGFASYIYLAEVALGKPLWDPNGTFTKLKARTIPYPRSLQTTIVTKFLWEAKFSVQIARKSVARRDVTYAAGCSFRAVMCLTQTLFALNEQYWMNEKGAVAIAATFPYAPTEFQSRIHQVFSDLTDTSEAIAQVINILDALVQETDTLVSLHLPNS
ncbi:nucleotidyltransferase domain-containing protein [Leptolyngbya sp. FACHB-36]|uniref:nucleotidyltransferase domain-containing protein n=1 Tax=Leptolyngbya sp. FACHB-36 TaxID=2692808 RepID=UPI0016810A29|nr:nucleotidyltransferase domain-containing protein [Leptolyngbya sp. FACHB-36]